MPAYVSGILLMLLDTSFLFLSIRPLEVQVFRNSFSERIVAAS